MMGEDNKNAKDGRLGDLLVERKLITGEQLDQAVQCQVLFGGRLGVNLLELGFIEEDTLLDLLKTKYGVKSATRRDLDDVKKETIALVPRRIAEKHLVIPVKLEEEELEIALLDPWRESSIRVLTEVSGLKINPVIALELDVYWALEKYYGVKRDTRYVNLDRWLEHRKALKLEREEAKRTIEERAEIYDSEPLLPDPNSITALEGQPRDLNDFWDRVGRTGHPEFLLARVKQDLERAISRDEVAMVVLDFAAMSFNRAVLFVANDDMLFGWDARGEGLNTRAALALMIPLSRRSMFKTVVETGAYFLGPVPDSPINKRFLAALGPTEPKTVLLLPVFVAGKVVAILYGDMGHDQKISGKLAPIQSAVSQAGLAFERMILSKKQAPATPPKKEE